MSKVRPRSIPAATALGGGSHPGFVPILFILVFAVTTLFCRKHEGISGTEKAGGGKEGTPMTPTAEVALPGAGPALREAPEPNRPPFSGLKTPAGAAVDDRGRLWIADSGNSAIRIFDVAGGFLGGWGSRGTGKYGLKGPSGIAIHGNDVYVSDTWNQGIVLYSLSGEWKASANPDLFSPNSLDVGPDGRVWIADTGNTRILVCNADLSNPHPIGKKGAGPEEFNAPMDIAVGPSGTVYVADVDNRRIQVLDSDGNFKRQLKFAGWGPGTPAYLEVDRDETLYATDPDASAVVQINKIGKEVHRWTTDDSGQKFSKPTGIALDRRSRTLYVVNSDTNSISKLRLSGKR